MDSSKRGTQLGASGGKASKNPTAREIIWQSKSDCSPTLCEPHHSAKRSSSIEASMAASTAAAGVRWECVCAIWMARCATVPTAVDGDILDSVRSAAWATTAPSHLCIAESCDFPNQSRFSGHFAKATAQPCSIISDNSETRAGGDTGREPPTARRLSNTSRCAVVKARWEFLVSLTNVQCP